VGFLHTLKTMTSLVLPTEGSLSVPQLDLIYAIWLRNDRSTISLRGSSSAFGFWYCYLQMVE
jgi:hypothetical protein